ncbi:MAG TPA: GIY-YIG nuclease family protein [Candidatus Marinimicrobia bacterium]|nr:GIY-YIG nuclease family protein [Candidatus Neomarinimicrobiota bacterium]
MRTGHFYILECSDGFYYTGVTNDPERRLIEHNEGITKGYTHSRRSVKLVFCSDEAEIMDTISFEKQVKGWHRENKEALINGDYD